MTNHDLQKSALGTYEGFVTLMKWGTVATLAVTAFVVLVIS